MDAGVLSPELDAALGAVLEEKEREGASKRELAHFVDDVAGALADPLVVYPGGWEDTVPKWLRDQVPLDRLLLMMEAKGKRVESGTDSEALAYISTVIPIAPVESEWANIYLWLGRKVMKGGLMAPRVDEKAFGKISPEKLSDQEKSMLEDLKAWIWRKRTSRRGRAEILEPSPVEQLPAPAAAPPPPQRPKKGRRRQKKAAALLMGDVSHAQWLERSARALEMDDRLGQMPGEFMRPWWAPECPEESPTAVPTSRIFPIWWDPARPPGAPVALAPRGSHWIWHNRHPIDADLKPEWIDRLNALPGTQIVLTCAGHVEYSHYPMIHFAIMLPDLNGVELAWWLQWELERDFGDLALAAAYEVPPSGAGGYAGYVGKIIVKIQSWIPREWMSLCEFVSWWEQLLGRLERFLPDLPRMVEEDLDS